jgi:hypothetical protein
MLVQAAQSSWVHNVQWVFLIKGEEIRVDNER